MLSTELLQKGVCKEWSNCLINIERAYKAKMIMEKVEAIQKTKNRCNERDTEHRENQKCLVQPNSDNIGDKGSEESITSEDWGGPWKNMLKKNIQQKRFGDSTIQNF